MARDPARRTNCIRVGRVWLQRALRGWDIRPCGGQRWDHVPRAHSDNTLSVASEEDDAAEIATRRLVFFSNTVAQALERHLNRTSTRRRQQHKTTHAADTRITRQDMLAFEMWAQLAALRTLQCDLVETITSMSSCGCPRCMFHLTVGHANLEPVMMALFVPTPILSHLLQVFAEDVIQHTYLLAHATLSALCGAFLLRDASGIAALTQSWLQRGDMERYAQPAMLAFQLLRESTRVVPRLWAREYGVEMDVATQASLFQRNAAHEWTSTCATVASTVIDCAETVHRTIELMPPDKTPLQLWQQTCACAMLNVYDMTNSDEVS